MEVYLLVLLNIQHLEVSDSCSWPGTKTLNKKLQVNSSFHLVLGMDWKCCLARFLHHNDSRKFDVCLYFFIFISQLFTNFHGFTPSVCGSWRIDLRDLNYMVLPWVLCYFNEWCFDFFSKYSICKFSNHWWNFIMLRNTGLVFFWSVSSFNFR